MASAQVLLLNHPLKNKILLNKEGKKYFIENVYEQDYKGHYLVLLTSQDHISHDMVFWQNIDCTSKVIDKIIDRNRKEMRLSN